MWNNHFQHVSKKTSTYLWLLSKIRFYLSVEHCLMFYNAYVKPHFVYSRTVWSKTSSGNINKITKLQKRACKLILSQDYRHSRGPETIKYTVTVIAIFLNKAKVM